MCAAVKAQARLVEHSINVIRAGQTEEGAYLAAPSFPTYRYSWFRDGSFVADAMDLFGEHDSAAAFHAWVVCTLRGRLTESGGVVGGDVLHTRYRADGSTGHEEWPNFQLDGFGTWLWAYGRHVAAGGRQAGPGALEVVRRLANHLAVRWAKPNFDCWEEHADRVHPSTLGAIYAGLRTAADLLGERYFLGVADAVRAYVLEHGVANGHFVKHVGFESVDANLLWLGPVYNLVPADHSLMRGTVEAVERRLQDPNGGVHRYELDTYYGGGSWLLLTADLAQAHLALGHRSKAEHLLAWIESRTTSGGDMPEQVADHVNDPSYVDEWRQLWGESACPLLWSHAAYLRLVWALERASAGSVGA